MSLLKKIRQFGASENGATMVEYGLIVGLLSLIVVGAVTTSGESLDSLFDSVAASLTRASSAAGGGG